METPTASTSTSVSQPINPGEMAKFVERVNRLSIGKSQNIRKGEPWFEDGNIVLITTREDSTAFRVHRGVLSRQSEIFNDMFQMPQSLTDVTATYEGCLVVNMHDLPSELSNLIKALYDGPTFSNNHPDGFFYLTGILRLATKYFIEHLRQSCIQYLRQTWPSTLKGHDDMVELALSSPTVNDLTFPYVHPLHVLNLARENNVNSIIPSALYFLSLYSLSGILHADHPKLLLEHPSKPSSMLSPSDVMLYSLMYQHRLQIMENFIREFCESRATQPKCGAPGMSLCRKGFTKLVSQLYRSCYLRTGPLHFILQAIHKINHGGVVCEFCSLEFFQSAERLRQEIWDDLPTVAQLPPWNRLD
ncbi:hypothetical protein CPC08DRAFT_739622 [Agrocybe pediades]|nr:hypothetical protein CPC08DRAFT_739622 [Agrocybe pediades]